MPICGGIVQLYTSNKTKNYQQVITLQDFASAHFFTFSLAFLDAPSVMIDRNYAVVEEEEQFHRKR